MEALLQLSLVASLLVFLAGGGSGQACSSCLICFSFSDPSLREEPDRQEQCGILRLLISYFLCAERFPGNGLFPSLVYLPRTPVYQREPLIICFSQ